MEWDDLKHFLAVARSGSLSDAAHLVKTSPATVGRRIAALEDRLGVHLFDRSQAGYRLTASGEAVLAKATDVEEAVLGVEREALGRDLRAAGRVRLATTEDLAAFVVAPHLGQLHDIHPDIELEIVCRAEFANLTRREADLALRAARPERNDHVGRRIGTVAFGLYTAKRYVEARGLRPGHVDVDSLDVIGWTEETTHLRGRWLAERAPRARVALAANATPVHYAACRAGFGATLMPTFVAAHDCDLVCLMPPEDVFTIDIWAVAHHDILRTARVRAVMDFLAGLGPYLRPRPA